MINIISIQDKLYEWATMETGITTIWEYPDAPRPDLPYFTLHILDMLRIGHDFVVQPTSASSGSKIWGNRDFTLTINYYGDNAMQEMEDLLSTLDKPTVQELLDEEHIAYVDRLAIQNLPELVDNVFEDRSVADVLLRVPSEITDTNVRIIETVEMGKTFKSPDLQTILVENITIPEP